MSAFCSTARLLDSTRLALRAFLFYLLCLAATLFTHTLSHAWCPVTLLSLTCCSTVVVTGLLPRVVERVIPWVPLVPLVLLRGASLLLVYRLLPSQSLFSIAMQCTGAFNRWVLCRSLVLPASFWSPSGVLLAS